MKKLYYLLICFLMVSNLSAQNLFTNPGFESGSTGWNLQVGAGAATANFETTPGRTGLYATSVTVTTVSPDNYQIQLQAPTFTAVAGNQYRLSFYAKADKSVPVHMAVQTGDPDYAYITGADGNFVAGADWKKLELVYTATTTGSGNLHFNIFMGTNTGNYIFDDFSAENITAPYPAAPVPPVEGAYYSNVYRNMFQEMGKTPADINAKVEAAFQQIFYGNPDTERLYYEVGKDMAYIKAPDSDDIRTEGLSYAMMICVQLDKKAEFDNLWKFSKTYSQHKTGSRNGYFAWQLNATPPFTIKDNNPASDGEEYFAMALFFAANRWGNGTDIFNYEVEANQILHDMLHKEEDNGGIVDGITNMFNLEEKKIVFVPQGGSALYSDPSYHLPAFYKLWSFWAKDDKAFWAAAADTSARYLTRAAHPVSGLVTDYMSFAGTPQTTAFNANSHRFAYDSWRVVGNIGMDVHWFGSQPWAINFNNKALNFFKSQGASYLSVYEYNGTPLATNNYHSAGHIAMNGVGALAANQANTTWPFVDELWNMNIPTGTYRYYDGMLYMMALLHNSGNFRIWKPGDPLGNSEFAGKAEAGINVYPNPGRNISISGSSNYTIGIFNISGVQIWKGDILTWNAGNKALDKEIYYIKVLGEGTKMSQKVVIE